MTFDHVCLTTKSYHPTMYDVNTSLHFFDIISIFFLFLQGISVHCAHNQSKVSSYSNNSHVLLLRQSRAIRCDQRFSYSAGQTDTQAFPGEMMNVRLVYSAGGHPDMNADHGLTRNTHQVPRVLRLAPAARFSGRKDESAQSTVVRHRSGRERRPGERRTQGQPGTRGTRRCLPDSINRVNEQN